MDLTGKRVLVAGSAGMAGSAIVRRLASEQCEIIECSRQFADLTSYEQTRTAFFASAPIHAVIMTAGRVGGILANSSFPVEFLTLNLSLALNVISVSAQLNVPKLLYVASSCVYPQSVVTPIQESSLLTGKLHPSTAPYGLAKIVGINLCQSYRKQYNKDFISCIPCNLYGPGDNYHLEYSHVVAALIRRFHEAHLAGLPSVQVWGHGTIRREFLYVDDFADACVHLLKHYSSADPVNVGSGEEVSIADLAFLIAMMVGYKGDIDFDISKPEGVRSNLLNSSGLRKADWTPRTSLVTGLRKAYESFLTIYGGKK